MELLSNQPRLQTVPDKYIFPPEKRPIKDIINYSVNLPVIDLKGGSVDGGDRDLIGEIMKAGKEFGFFQIINHGIPEKTINDMMQVCDEFFSMPPDEKARYYSDDLSKVFLLNSSTTYDKSETRYWRDYLRLVCYPIEGNEIRYSPKYNQAPPVSHICILSRFVPTLLTPLDQASRTLLSNFDEQRSFTPIEEVIDHWPEKPENFRAALSEFTVQVREVSSKLLKLIAEGLGLDKDYFGGDYSEGRTQMNINHYPPCPDPSLTMGLLPHCDRHLITLLAQGTAASGLQVKYNDGWTNVEPIPNAFVVNFGHQLEILTNGILKSVEHRAVTNSAVARTSIATLIMPKTDCLIAPAKELLNENNLPKYKEFVFRDFLKAYDAASASREGVLEFFKLN